jgi:CubicO group peptidase (beta-lactamase class C family)
MQPRGVVDDRFAKVGEVFAELLASGAETGAGLVVRHGGEAVVRLAGGWADAARTTPWRDDSLVHVYSVSKPFAALTALKVLADNGIRLDGPVADLWPDYAAAGKAATTLRQLLSHQAGQPAFPATARDLFDDAGLRAALAAAPPEWAPGTAFAEHALTYGHLVDGVVRAVTGRTLGTVFRQDVAGPLGLDAHFGVPTADLARVAELEYRDRQSWKFGEPGDLAHRALAVPPGALDVAVLNSDRWRQTEFPAIGLHTTAASGRDLFLGYDLTWTPGLQRSDSELAMGGIGGSTAWVSLRHGYSCAFVTRHLAGPERIMAIEEAIESAW